MKEYGLSDEELVALGENPVAYGKSSHIKKSEPKQPETHELWDGDFDFLMDFWL